MDVFLPGLTPDCLPPMDGRTVYLFKGGGGASGACCSTGRAPSSCLLIVGWDWERRDLLGLLDAGQSGDTDCALRVASTPPECEESSTDGLLRPLEDFGLVRCIGGNGRVENSPLG